MKKVFFIFLFAAATTTAMFAQKGGKEIGGSLGYLGSWAKKPSLGVKFNYGISEAIRLSPSFNYYLVSAGSAWDLNADVHYMFAVSPKMWVYPLGGVAVAAVSGGSSAAAAAGGGGGGGGGAAAAASGSGSAAAAAGGGGGGGGGAAAAASSSGSSSSFGINLGCGLACLLTNSLSLGFEMKYGIETWDMFVPSVCLTYKF
ncbi:MAG: hypothetical protein LBR67_02365 [Dysgonamonadaceae bacterium]|jgi:outer membrane protein X|nr:hypothetical protein [Dysgonamonadaceae bacterium]